METLQHVGARRRSCMVVVAGAVMAVDGADATYCPSLRNNAPLQLGGAARYGPVIPQGHLALFWALTSQW